MIFNTNRTASLNDDIVVDVNESYFGAGSLDFMQENAQDELALFEAAIKSDIDEVLIGESTTELEALNESFKETAVNKIKEMMKKFIEWIQGITRSILAKLHQLINRDNDKFVKQARKMIIKMKNSKNFKYSGKALVISKLDGVKGSALDDRAEALYDQAKNAKSEADIEKCKSELEKVKEIYRQMDMRKNFEDACITEVEGEDLRFVEAHIKVLEDYGKKNLAEIKKELKDAEKKAKDIAKKAEKKSSEYNGEDTLERSKLSLMADCAATYRNICQTITKDSLYMLKKTISVARAVVANAMGATPDEKAKNEGFMYDEEMIQAMIETADFEYDEALEEMSEAKECDDIEDDIDEEDK